MPSVTVHELFVYPIKSLGGVRLTSADVEARGFRDDRRWMVVDARGEFMTQRRHPRMALGQVELLENALRVRAPGVGELHVPRADGAPRPLRVRVWRDDVEADDCGDEAAGFFTALLDEPARLVRMPERARRSVDSRHAAPDDVVSFADAFPFLFLSVASIHALNERLAAKVEVRRFRPNVLLTGCPAFDEDTWTHVRVGEATFRVVKPCARCQIVTVDPDSAAVAKEPLTVLAAFRAGDVVPGGRKRKVYFGQNAVADASALGRTVRTGDRVEVLVRRSLEKNSA